MKTIKTTKGLALVDDDLFDFLNTFRWCGSGNGYAMRMIRWEGRQRQKAVYMHHVVIGFPLNGNLVDHIDGNTLNNQRNNLRIVTNRENQRNQKRHRAGATPGLYWHKGRKRWVAQAWVNGKKKWLGEYRTKEAALANA